MGSELLTLVGHLNPFDEYPAMVVPVCRRLTDHSLVACYGNGGEDVRLVDLPESTGIATHRLPLQHFDPAVMRLFGIASDAVEIYGRGAEGDTMERLRQANVFRFANPFLTLPIACALDSVAFVTTTLRLCLAELGLGSDFVDNWYYNVFRDYGLSRFGLPETRSVFMADVQRVVLGCPIDKEQWIRRLCRGFNADSEEASEFGVQQVVVQVTTGRSLDEPPCDAEVPNGLTWEDVEAHRSAEQYVPLWQGALAIAVNPKSRIVESRRTGWVDVLTQLAEDQSSRWVQGRVESLIGGITDAVIEEAFSRTARAGGAQLFIAGLGERARFAPSDLAIIDAAVNGFEWKADALIAQEISIRALLSDLPMDRLPIVIPVPGRELLVPNGVVLDERSEWSVRAAINRLSDSLAHPVAAAELNRAGARSGDVAAPVAAIVHTLRERYRSSERPIAVYLVVDASASMQGEKLQAAKIGMAAFLGQMSRERGDCVGLIAFGSVPRILVPLGPLAQNENPLGEAIASIQGEGRTAIHDSLMLALKGLAPYNANICAAMLLTDGRENASRQSESDVLRSIDEGSAQVFVLGYGEDADIDLLQRISSRARGAAFVGSVANVRAVMAAMARQV